jgi:hypothetical protein
VWALRPVKRLEQASLLPPEAMSAPRWGLPSASASPVQQQREAAVLASRWERPSVLDAAVVPQQVVVAVARQQAVAAQVSDAAVVPQQGAAAESDAAEGPLQEAAVELGAVVEQPPEVAAAVLDAGVAPQPAAVEVSDAAAVLQQEAAVAALDAAVPRLAVRAESAASQPAAGPSVAASVFRQGRALPSLARRRAARSVHAMRMSQAASRSERSWQAARGEGLS